MASFVLSFFPLDVLDEIWGLIESVSEGFLTYPCFRSQFTENQFVLSPFTLTQYFIFSYIEDKTLYICPFISILFNLVNVMFLFIPS